MPHRSLGARAVAHLTISRRVPRAIRAGARVVTTLTIGGVAAIAEPLTAQVPAAPAGAAVAQPGAKRPLTMEDLLGWKGIRSPVLSNDGRWLAYVLAPNEGDGELVVRGTQAGAAETRVPIGEPPAGLGGAGGIAVSGNNRWVADTVYPKAEDAKKARRDRRTLPTSVGVIELATGATREFERVRSFRFAGDRSNVLALQLMPPDAPGGAPATGASANAGAGAGAAGTSGGNTASTVLLVDLAGGTPVTLVGVGEWAFDASGQFLAWTVEQRDQLGNGVQVRELSSGIVRALDAEKAIYRRLTWADTGDALAVLRSVADTATKDTLTTALGWSRLGSASPAVVRIDERSAGITGGLVVSADRAPKWSDGQQVL